MKLDAKLVDVFCAKFGEDYRDVVSPHTNMDEIEGWDSLNYIDFVCDIEDAYDIEFSDTEAAQMFQLGHIQRIINTIVNHRPQEDVSHAYCQLQMILSSDEEIRKVVVFSGSSTREGLLPLADTNKLIKTRLGDGYEFFNISVSGLVLAETLQLIESIQHVKNTMIVIGYSSVILYGCGVNEFKRSALHERFRLHAPLMDQVLRQSGFDFSADEISESHSVSFWIQRFLEGKRLEELKYHPYKYPTLAPWDEEKFSDPASILMYYNQSLLNFTQSFKVNSLLFDQIIKLYQNNGFDLCFLQLTLHDGTKAFINQLGDLDSLSDNYIHKLCEDHDVSYFNAVDLAKIRSSDFRDPGHIYKNKESYTEAIIECIRCFDRAA